MRIDLAMSAVVVFTMPLRANRAIAALTNRSRVITFCSRRVVVCIRPGSITEHLLSEYILSLPPMCQEGDSSARGNRAAYRPDKRSLYPVPLPVYVWPQYRLTLARSAGEGT